MQEKIKLLHLAQCAGGVDRYLRMLLGHMDRARFEQVVVASDSFRPEDYRGLADRFIRLPMSHALSPLSDARAVREVREIVRREKPDIVYCHSSKAGGIGRLACIGLNVKTVYNPHGWAFSMKGSRWKSLVYLIIERLLAPLTDRFVVISHYEKLTAVEHRVAREGRLKVIFNGVDLQQCTSEKEDLRAQLGIEREAYVVGMVGRISPQKAPDVFVRMAKEVKQCIPEARFILVGDGELRAMVEQEIDRAGLKNVFTITGWVDDAQAYIRMFDQAVLLSRWEGFGLAIAEYMMMRKPIVATEVGGIADLIVDHDSGLLVPPDNPTRAAEAVVELYRNPSMKQEMIEKAELRARACFDVKRTAMEHERLFVNICE